MSKNLKGHLAALLAVCVWGLSGYSYSALRAYLTPIEIILAGIAVTFAVLNLMYLPRLHLKKTTHELWFVLAGGLGVALYFYLEYSALARTSRESVSVILALVPLFCSLLSAIFLKSGRSSAAFYSGVGFGVGGVFLITFFKGGSFSFDLVGSLYALGAALCLAAFFVTLKRITNLGHSTVQLVRRVFFWGIVFLIPLCFVMDFDYTEYKHLLDVGVLFNMLFVGIITPGVCYVSFAYSMRQLGAVKTSAYIYAAPVASIVLWAFIGESAVSPTILIGVIVAIIGITLSVKK